MPTNDEALFVPIDDIDILNNTKDRTEDAIQDKEWKTGKPYFEMAT